MVLRRMGTRNSVSPELPGAGRDPMSGDVIPGTGGVRKLRWGRAGSGKRGGARVIYFYYDMDRPLYLLLAYAKAGAEDLTADEKKAASAVAAVIKGAAK